MKKFFPFVFCALLLVVSCKKSKEAIEPETPEPEKPELVEEFLFQNIKFSVPAGYQETSVIQEKPISELINKTSVVQQIIADGTNGVTEASVFKSDVDYVFKIKDVENLTISVPESVVNGEIHVGSKKWKYSNSAEYIPTVIKVVQSFPVAPGTRTKVTATLTFRQNLADYTATFVGEKTGKRITVTGKWKGTILTGVAFKDKSGPAE